MDFRDAGSSALFLRASGDPEPFEEQLACDPEPEVKVELLLSDELLLNVRTRGFFATGEIGGVEIRELK